MIFQPVKFIEVIIRNVFWYDISEISHEFREYYPIKVVKCLKSVYEYYA